MLETVKNIIGKEFSLSSFMLSIKLDSSFFSIKNFHRNTFLICGCILRGTTRARELPSELLSGKIDTDFNYPKTLSHFAAHRQFDPGTAL